jgi:hypothetical protein
MKLPISLWQRRAQETPVPGSMQVLTLQKDFIRGNIDEDDLASFLPVLKTRMARSRDSLPETAHLKPRTHLHSGPYRKKFSITDS